MTGYVNEKYHWCPTCDDVLKPVNQPCPDCIPEDQLTDIPELAAKLREELNNGAR